MFWLVGSLNGLKWTASCQLCLAHISAYHNDVIRPSINHNGIRRRYSERIRPEDSTYQIIVGLLVIVLAGASVSIVGPIGFIGLIVLI